MSQNEMTSKLQDAKEHGCSCIEDVYHYDPEAYYAFLKLSFSKAMEIETAIWN